MDEGEKAHQAVVVEVPPLDRYLPNGEVATFGDTDKIAEANRWTLEKAKELQSNEGLHYTEIDKQIDYYLYGEYETKKLSLSKKDDGGDRETKSANMLDLL